MMDTLYHLVSVLSENHQPSPKQKSSLELNQAQILLIINNNFILINETLFYIFFIVSDFRL